MAQDDGDGEAGDALVERLEVGSNLAPRLQIPMLNAAQRYPLPSAAE
jgi:hypothetical protein